MIREILCIVLSSLGFLFFVTSALGVIRLPDFFSRLHASGIGETMGMCMLGAGLIIYEGFSVTSLKILFIIIALFAVNPVATHLIGKAALYSGEHSIDDHIKEEKNADIHS